MLLRSMALVWLLAMPLCAEPLTFGEVLKDLQGRHPRLQSARLRWTGARAYSDGIGTQPNPTLRLGDTAGNPMEEVNSIGQILEISGQPGLRREIALREAGMRRQDFRLLQRELTRQAGVSFYEYWGGRARQAVGESRLKLLQELTRLSRRRLEAGEISRNQHERIELEAVRAQADVEQTVGQANAAKAALAALLVRTPEEIPEPAADEAPLTQLSVPATLDALMAQLDQAPELVANRLEQERVELQGHLAEKEMAPKLQFLGYRSRLYNQDGATGAQLAISFPLWDYGSVDAEVQRLAYERQALEKQRDALALAWKQQIRQAWERWQAQKRRADLLARQSAGLLRLAQMAQKGFDAGLVTILEVLDAQRAYREVLFDWIEAQVQVRQAEVELFSLAFDPVEVGDAP